MLDILPAQALDPLQVFRGDLREVSQAGGVDEQGLGFLGSDTRDALEHRCRLFRAQSAMILYGKTMSLVPDLLEGAQTGASLGHVNRILSAWKEKPVDLAAAGLGYGHHRHFGGTELFKHLQEDAQLAFSAVYHDEIGSGLIMGKPALEDLLEHGKVILADNRTDAVVAIERLVRFTVHEHHPRARGRPPL